MNELKSFDELIIDEVCEMADELENMDDLYWYFVSAPNGRLIMGTY